MTSARFRRIHRGARAVGFALGYVTAATVFATLTAGLVAGVLAGDAGCADSTQATFLNPDPTTGGACGNGDQLASLCGKRPHTWCCPADTVCGPGVGECSPNVYDPSNGLTPIFSRAPGRDAGLEAGEGAR